MAVKEPKKKVTLALQGGASYGAFTWGVLDRLLEDDRIEIVGVSGASAGAINAAALAYGMDMNGPEGARESLRQIWHALSYEEIAKKMPVLGEGSKTMNKGLKATFNFLSKFDKKGKAKQAHTLIQGAIIAWTASKGEFFESGIEKVIDFDELHKNKDGIPLYVSATDIQRHKPRIFDRTDISASAIKASCAVPDIFKDVEIDGRIYWDGGFTENPAINPLKHCDSEDVIIIQTLPILKRKGPDEEATDEDLLYELLFNSSVRKDIEHIQSDNRKVKRDPEAAERLGIRTRHTHVINSGKVMPRKMTMCFDQEHLGNLHDMGYEAADKWLEENFDKLGKESTFSMNKAKPPSAHKRHSPHSAFKGANENENAHKQKKSFWRKFF